MTSKDKPYEDLWLSLSPSWKATESKQKAVQSSFLDDERPYKVRGPEIQVIPVELSLPQYTCQLNVDMLSEFK